MKPHRERKLKVAKFFVENERPEEFAEDTLEYYNEERVEEYANSKALMRIQEKITYRAMNIAQVKPPARVLDLGMGCGFATTYLYINKYNTVGVDLNRDFLTYYHTPELNPIQGDMRYLGFRPQSFDMVISISAIQWVLAEKNDALRQKLIKQIAQCCGELLIPGGKVVMQLYPKSDESMKEMGAIFADSGYFEGNFIIDNVDSPRKRKVFLYLERKYDQEGQDQFQDE
jgi:SAM-dependent methyltransferase